jgi:hypothetical protein
MLAVDFRDDEVATCYRVVGKPGLDAGWSGGTCAASNAPRENF